MRGKNGATTTPIAEDSDKGPLLFLAFDEAANLFKSDSDVRFAALRRVLKLHNEFPIWSVFLSTKSRIEYPDPPEKADPSARIRNQRLSRIYPFIGLELDVEASRRLADPVFPGIGETPLPLRDLRTYVDVWPPPVARLRSTLIRINSVHGTL